MQVAIIDYGSGNLHSAQKAFQRMMGERGLSGDIVVSADPDVVRKADRIVLPGVGAFADCKRGLAGVSGMIAAMEEAVLKGGRPFLGICVGMQLMASEGREKEITAGLGWLKGAIGPITPADPALKVPHMGWNTLDLARPHPLLNKIKTGPDGLHAYFVHSYHLVDPSPEILIASAPYGGAVTAIVGRDTMIGTQFHPEKSQKLGLALIGNFLEWAP